MAETTVQIKPTEAAIMAAQRNKVDTMPTLSPKLEEARTKGKELRRLQEQGLSGKDRILALKEASKVKFASRDRDDLILSFGAGLAKKEGNNIVIDSSADQETKSSFESGKEVAEPISNLILYTDIIEQSKALNKSAERVAIDERRMNGGQWVKCRGDALKYLLEEGVMREIFPELYDGTMSQDSVKAFLETTLASDPKLRQKLSEKMKSALQRAKSFEEAETDPGLKQAEETKNSLSSEINQRLERIIGDLRDSGLEIESDVRDDLERMVKEGRSGEAIRKKVEQVFIGSFSDQQRKQINDYLAANQQVASLREELTGLIRGEYKDKVEEELIGARQNLAQLSAGLNQASGFSAAFSRYQKISKILGGDPQTTPLLQEFTELIRKGQEYRKSEQDIQAKKPDAEKKMKAKRANRLQQESELISDMEQYLKDSIIETVTERMEEAEGFEKQRLNEIAEKANTEGVKRVKDSMSTRWIEYKHDGKKRKREVHTKNISQDIRYALYHGEEDEGIKRLVLRDLEVTEWKTIKFSDLQGEQKAMFEESWQKCGEDYKKKLLTSFFEARSAVHVVGPLSLKGHEWKLLEKHFGGTIDDALSKSKEGQDALNKIKEKGIVPGFKLKYLLYVLLALGLLGGGTLFKFGR